MARVTLVSRNFPPLTGGMERLFQQLYLQLRDLHDICLLGPAGCERFVRDDCDVRATAVSPTALFLLLSLFKGVLAHRSGRRPALIIGGSGLVGPVVIWLARLAGSKSVLLLHGLDIVVQSRLYRWLFIPFFRKADAVICNSHNTARLARAAGVPAARITIIHPGVDLPAEVSSQRDAKRSLGLGGKTVLLSLGRLIPRKGIAEFLRNGFADIAAHDANCVFLIAGSEPADALHRRRNTVLAGIQSTIAALGLGDRVQLLGQVDDATIASLYAAADVFVFPLVETPGDVEGFGMVAIEAAAHGTPTVAFDCGGIGDAVADGASGFLVAAGDYGAFVTSVSRAVRGEMRHTAREFAERFSWDRYGTQLRSCLDKVLI